MRTICDNAFKVFRKCLECALLMLVTPLGDTVDEQGLGVFLRMVRTPRGSDLGWGTEASLPILLRCPSGSFHHLAALLLPSRQNDSTSCFLLALPAICQCGSSLSSVGELGSNDSLRKGH